MQFLTRSDLAEVASKATEEFIKNNKLGPGLLVKFARDPKEYIIKNLSPDRQHVFVTGTDGIGVFSKLIMSIERINRSFAKFNRPKNEGISSFDNSNHKLIEVLSKYWDKRTVYLDVNIKTGPSTAKQVINGKTCKLIIKDNTLTLSGEADYTIDLHKVTYFYIQGIKTRLELRLPISGQEYIFRIYKPGKATPYGPTGKSKEFKQFRKYYSNESMEKQKQLIEALEKLTGKKVELKEEVSTYDMQDAYSFSKMGYTVGNAFLKACKANGFNDDVLEDIFRSKYPRWFMDSNDDAISKVAYELAFNYIKKEKKQIADMLKSELGK